MTELNISHQDAERASQRAQPLRERVAEDRNVIADALAAFVPAPPPEPQIDRQAIFSPPKTTPRAAPTDRDHAPGSGAPVPSRSRVEPPPATGGGTTKPYNLQTVEERRAEAAASFEAIAAHLRAQTEGNQK